MKLTAQSGCIELFIGFESLSQANLDASHKSWVRADKIKEYVKIFNDHGIIVEGAFIFGHDGDRKDIFRRTVDFIQETGIQVPVFGILTPYPATRLRAKLEGEGRLLPEAKDWRLYDGSHVLFKPIHMTPEELEEGFLWARKYCAAPRTIFRRMFRAPRANWADRPWVEFFHALRQDEANRRTLAALQREAHPTRFLVMRIHQEKEIPMARPLNSSSIPNE